MLVWLDYFGVFVFALSGAVAYTGLAVLDVAAVVALWTGAVVCFAVRASAIIWGWSLPTRQAP